MAEGDQSSMSASTPLLPSKLTSEQISGLIVLIKPTSPNLEKTAEFALPDQGTAHTQRADDEVQSSASREIAKLHDVNIMHVGDGIEASSEDKLPDEPAINGQLASICPRPRKAQEGRKRRPLLKLKWEGRSYSPEGGEEEEGGESACVTPTAREQRIPQEILICPPPPCKKRHCSKRKTRGAMASSSSSSEQAYAGANLQLIVNPPDLHTFPDCIRALFSPN